MGLKEPNLMQQVKNDRYNVHELLDLEEGIKRIYLLESGIFMTPKFPHTSIIVAESLQEADKYLEDTILNDFEVGKGNIYWSDPNICLFGSYPRVRIIEKEIKQGNIYTDTNYGRLEIRPMHYSILRDYKGAVLTFEETIDKRTTIPENRIIVSVEEDIETALKKIEEKNVRLSTLNRGYVADILPPPPPSPGMR